MRERERDTERRRRREIERETDSEFQPPFGPSVRSDIHASQQQTFPIIFLSLKSPPAPCAVLLVVVIDYKQFMNLIIIIRNLWKS